MLVNTTAFLASQVRNSISATAQSTNALFVSLKTSLGLVTADEGQRQHTNNSQEVEQQQQ
ncbi:hypothetical protein BGX29_010950, partial [Mortierella sp. GBA35]